ncbi:MAG TPA: carboxypeptidase regulatory-like domain-containing protein [Candidatus Angelobacter sp.]|nr:carboxypeptidase regulatory-like domain-containing protein [Candidatus Angelobacter sp.]
MKRGTHKFLFLMAMCLLTGILLGQVLKGSISGTVIDPQGAVVPAAQVKATNTDTGAVYTTTSDNAGLFRFNLIPSGSYKVEISSPGFSGTLENGVAVAAGVDSSLGSVKLSVGQASTTVEVSAEAPLIETTQSQVTNTVSGTALHTFAGIQENEGLDNIATSIPGVTAARDNGFSNTNGGTGFVVNGIRGRNNDQQIDGLNNNDNSVGGPSLFLGDAEFVQQYVLITNQFGPEYGRNAGSVVNVITKSGTNNWHGSIYGSENNTNMNSLTNIQKQFLNLNGIPRANDEFGGFTIGGPVVKNKLFIFGGFDQEIISQKTAYANGLFTPTPAGLTQLSACFPGSASIAALTSFGPYAFSTGNPQPTSTTTLKNVSGCGMVPFAGVGRTLSTPSHIFDWIARTDLQLGHDTVVFRYLFQRNNLFNLDDGLNDAASGFPINEPDLNQSVLGSWTHNITSHMVNEARGGFTRLNVEFGGNSLGTVPTTAGISTALARTTFNVDPTLMSIGPATNIPQGRIVNTWQAQDNWSYVLGKHQLKAGVNYTFQRSPNTFLPILNGTFRFDDFSTFAANTPNRVQVANGNPGLDFREHDTFLYIGDDWKATQSLTLNLGVTWSYYGQPANLFNTNDVQNETGPNPLFNPALPLSVRAFPTLPSIKTSIGPSAGFAWAPQGGGFLTGGGKTVIRGGYRLLYDPPFYNIYLNIATSAPQVFLQSIRGAAANAIPMPATPTGTNVRAALSPFLTPGTLDPRTQNETTVTPDFGPDRVHTWTLGIERQTSKNSAIEARYVGNHGTALFQSIDGNPFIADLATAFPSMTAGLTPCPAAQAVVPQAIGRVNCNEGIVRERTNGGYSNYNGVQVEFRANNLFKQLTLRTGYTFSRTYDNVSEIFSTGGGGNTSAWAANPLDPKNGEYAFSGIDIPHQWSIVFTEELPFFKDQHGLMGHLLGGWGFSGNYLLASGQRYTPVQSALEAVATQPLDLYDVGFIGAFVGTDTARPFVGNLSAPSTSVGIFAADFCGAIAANPATDPACQAGVPGNTLLSLNALNNVNGEQVVTVNKNSVRFIVNGATAAGVFGTPFGARRNLVQDAITNTANASIFKRFRFTERVSAEFHASATNVFNHSNFQSIDPTIEDAGIRSAFTGFGDPSVTNTVIGNALGQRIIRVGATVRF